MSASGPKQTQSGDRRFRTLGERLDLAHIMRRKKVVPMGPLDTTTFVIVFVAAIVVMGGFIGLKFHSEKKKRGR